MWQNKTDMTHIRSIYAFYRQAHTTIVIDSIFNASSCRHDPACFICSERRLYFSTCRWINCEGLISVGAGVDYTRLWMLLSRWMHFTSSSLFNQVCGGHIKWRIRAVCWNALLLTLLSKAHFKAFKPASVRECFKSFLVPSL